MITLFKITALTAILPRIQNGTGAKPSGTSFTPCDHNEVNVRFQNDNKLVRFSPTPSRLPSFVYITWQQGQCWVSK